MGLPTADDILYEGSKQRVLLIQPWVAAQLYDVWISMKKNIIAQKDNRGPAAPAKPASSHNRT